MMTFAKLYKEVQDLFPDESSVIIIIKIQWHKLASSVLVRWISPKKIKRFSVEILVTPHHFRRHRKQHYRFQIAKKLPNML